MPIHELKAHDGIANRVGLSPDGKRFYSGSYAGGVKIWETESGRLLREYVINDPILACRFDDDGSVLYAAPAARKADHPDIHKLV